MIKYHLPLVECIWNDAETTNGWETNDEADTNQVPIITIGFLVTKGEHVVIIASSIDADNGTQNNARIKIPLAMIQSIRELSVSHKKVRKTQESPQSESELPQGMQLAFEAEDQKPL